MELYHTSFSGPPNGVCSHFGSLSTGVNLLDGMFVAKTPRGLGFDGKETIVFIPEYKGHRASGRLIPSHTETPEETLLAFADFAGKAHIYKFEIELGRSLRLNDTWGDDPIGSGGPPIFEADTDLGCGLTV
jgi:hypothetical protein